MRWLRRHEGYLLIDHRDSPGMVDDKSHPLGRSQITERPIYTCSHCQRGVVVNPLRSRDRGYCPKCDHIVCDECEAQRVASGGACLPFRAVADQMQEAALRAEQVGGEIVVPANRILLP